MELYSWVFFSLTFITSIYTLFFAKEVWNNKNRLGACFIAILAISIIAIPTVSLLLI